MTAIALVHGTIRQVTSFESKAKKIIREAHVLTEFGAVLGETLRVTVFEPRPGEVGPTLREGSLIWWVVEIDHSSWGLRATIKRELSPADVSALVAVSSAASSLLPRSPVADSLPPVSIADSLPAEMSGQAAKVKSGV